MGEIAELRKEQIIPNGTEQPYIGLEHIEQQSLRLNGVGSSNSVISNKFKFYSGDILYGKLRPYFRKVYQPKFEGVCSTDIYVIKNKKPVDRDFLYYLIATEEFTNIANSGSSGTRMPRADWKQLQNSEWNLPNIETQTQIAQILTSLDDKIELNLQMNQTLEAMAQALFKEWFVNFNFPNCLNYDSLDLLDEHDFEKEEKNQEEKNQGNQENPKNQGSDNLPKGWRMGKLNEVAKIEIGRTPPRLEELWFSKDVKDNKWISIRDMGQSGVYIFNTLEYLTNEAIEKFRIPVIQENTVVLSFKLTIGRLAITTEKMLSNEAIAQINTNEFPPEYIYLYLKTYNWDSLGSTSSIATAVNSKTIKEMGILIPSIDTLNSFKEVITPIFEKIKYNSLQIQTLTQTRDTLLPKLMSGRLNLDFLEDQDSKDFSKPNQGIQNQANQANPKNQGSDK
ncbi:MAG: restriction endonuclease subunit S [Cytophagales bacterium]|nr:MAG: restriction endonuclease subunit S [Cytophagales bacterium]